MHTIPWKNTKKIGTHPSDNLLTWYRDMNCLFEDFFGDFNLNAFEKDIQSIAPKIITIESDKESNITAESPATEFDAAHVNMNYHYLTIGGEKSEK